MRRARAALLAVVALVAALLAPAGAEPPPLTSWPYEAGYVPLPDGAELRYTVFLPDTGSGPWPVLLQYDGYAAGTNPYENGQNVLGETMRAKGYAILGVNVRGSGCSSGTWDVLAHQWAVDGYSVVEWAAAQPWSNGSIGMFGVSLPAILSLYVAAERPPHLAAVAPGAALTDVYRDVAYPGGLFNTSFANAWTVLQKGTGYQDTALVVAADGGDPRCLAYTAGHTAPDKVTGDQVRRHPYDDAFYASRSLRDRIADIDVPVLSMTSWQDEQVSGRIASALPLLDPATSYAVLSNGNHGVSIDAAAFVALEEDFFDHYVAGVGNGFETTTPHVQVWHELQASRVPRWVSSYAAWPAVTATSYALSADGRLAPGAAPAASGARSFAYPAPGAPSPSLGYDSETAAWKAPGSGVSWTTDPFATDVEAFGTASADLWVSSTAADTDLQVTISEVRPDGQETYVQRGWLRASHRALDASRSTALLPWHPHTAAAETPLTPGVPALVRVEVMPFGHVFRAGSRLRLTVGAPSATGWRVFQTLPGVAVDTVHTGGATPSRLLLGTVPATGVVASYPECDTLVNQPCRLADIPG